MNTEQVQNQGERNPRYILGGMGRGEWLHIAIDIRAKRALENLASCHGVSQRNILEHLLAQAEQTLLEEGTACSANMPCATPLPADSEVMAS